jgi:hypothetical protein
MSNTTKGRTVIGIIRSVDRKSTSRMGNPTYKITMEDGIEYVTQTNGAVGYGATNYRPRHGQAPRLVILSLTPAGRVWNIEDAASTIGNEIVAIVRDDEDGITRVRHLNPGSNRGRLRGESDAEYQQRRGSHGLADVGSKFLSRVVIPCTLVPDVHGTRLAGHLPGRSGHVHVQRRRPLSRVAATPRVLTPRNTTKGPPHERPGSFVVPARAGPFCRHSAMAC